MPSLDDFPSVCIQRAALKEDMYDIVRSALAEEMQIVSKQHAAEQDRLFHRLDLLDRHMMCLVSGYRRNEMDDDIDLDKQVPIERAANFGDDFTEANVKNEERTVQGHEDAANALKEQQEKGEETVPARTVSHTTLRGVVSHFFGLDQESRSWLECTILSPAFNALANFVILANSCYMGIEAASQVRHAVEHIGEGPNKQHQRQSYQVELIFTTFYALELALKIGYFKLEFFRGAEAGWNNFDFLVVLSSLIGVLTSSGGHISLLRMLLILKQVIKTSRLMRVVRHCRELRVIIISMARSYMSFLTGMGTLLIFMYMVSITLCQGVASYLSNTSPLVINEDIKRSCIRFWGTLPRALMTLFQSVSGGGPWRDCLQPLVEAGAMYVIIFLLYISVLVFALTKLLTGIFVQQAKEANEHDRVQIIETNIRKLLSDMDDDGSGFITKDEFLDHLTDKRANDYYALLQITGQDAAKIFDMIDQEEDNKVDIDEFISGCHQFKGYAKSIDMAVITYHARDLMKQLNLFMQYAEENFEFLSKNHHIKQLHTLTPLRERLKQLKSLRYVSEA